MPARKEGTSLSGNKLSFYLAVQNMSKRQLAQQTGLSPTIISAYAKGTAFPSVIHAIAIARALKCSVHDIWDAQAPDESVPAHQGVFRNVWSSIPKNEGG